MKPYLKAFVYLSNLETSKFEILVYTGEISYGKILLDQPFLLSEKTFLFS
jgi:hypothetical protein